MASKVENSIEVNRPVADVFAFVDDYKNTTRYLVGMTEYKPTTDRVNGKGARFKLVKKTTGLPDIKSEIEIVEWEQDKKIVFRSVSGFDNGGQYTFSATARGTTVRLSNTYDLTSLLGGGGGLFGGLKKAAGGAMSKVAEGQAKADLTKSLENIKRLVEAAPARASTAAAKPAAAKRPAAKKTAAKKPASAAKSAKTSKSAKK